ncbi:type II secretion system protein GspN [Halodesulfovibrio spirochaetisodalis]|nr:type II secretion system protein GspN [Halodesulfovibrio spirochaetisodalis]
MSLLASFKNKVSLPSISFGFSKGLALKVCLYLLFGSVMFSAFLGMRMAEHDAVPMLRNALASIPAVNIQPGKIDLSFFPPRLEVDSVYFAKKRSRNALVELNDLIITVDYGSLFTGRLGVDVSALCYGGKITAHAETGSLFDVSTVSAVVDIKNQPLGKIPFLRMQDPDLKGKGTVHVQYSGSTQDITKGEGRLTLAGSGLRFKNPVPIIKKERFEEMVVTASAALDGSTLTVKDFTVREKTMRGNVKGSMKMNLKNIIDSKVSMKSRLFIPPKDLIVELLDANAVNRLKAGEEITVSINGRLASPTIIMK